MPTITHNKLVRDKIPEIITSAGKQTVTRILSDEEYLAELDRKLTEECAEARGYSIEELEQVRAAKSDERGGFTERIFLEKVVEL